MKKQKQNLEWKGWVDHENIWYFGNKEEIPHYPYMPIIKEVDQDSLGSYLGYTDPENGIIYISALKYDEDLKPVADGIKAYVLGHELYVEWFGRRFTDHEFKNEEEHARLEAEYLENSEDEKIFGVIYHGINLEDQGFGYDFSARVIKYAPWIKDAYENYKRLYPELVEKVREVLKQV
ncbi:MAG: hypothetical protein QW703_00310 [Candidatus Aenigmatarchaeota archaeon]